MFLSRLKTHISQLTGVLREKHSFSLRHITGWHPKRVIARLTSEAINLDARLEHLLSILRILRIVTFEFDHVALRVCLQVEVF